MIDPNVCEWRQREVNSNDEVNNVFVNKRSCKQQQEQKLQLVGKQPHAGQRRLVENFSCYRQPHTDKDHCDHAEFEALRGRALLLELAFAVIEAIVVLARLAVVLVVVFAFSAVISLSLDHCQTNDLFDWILKAW